jgi:hypothetical protein
VSTLPCRRLCIAQKLNARRTKARAQQWIGNYSDTAVKHYECDEPEHFRGTKGYEFHTVMADATKRSASSFRDTFLKTQVYATPEKCIETLRTIAETMDAAEFVGFFRYGGMPLEVAGQHEAFRDERFCRISSVAAPASLTT